MSKGDETQYLVRDLTKYPPVILDHKATSLLPPPHNPTTLQAPPNAAPRVVPLGAPLFKPVFKKRSRSSAAPLDGVVSSFASFHNASANKHAPPPYTRNLDGGGADMGIPHSAFEYHPPTVGGASSSPSSVDRIHSRSTFEPTDATWGPTHDVFSSVEPPATSPLQQSNHNHRSHPQSAAHVRETDQGDTSILSQAYAQKLELHLLTALMEEFTLHCDNVAKSAAVNGMPSLGSEAPASPQEAALLPLLPALVPALLPLLPAQVPAKKKSAPKTNKTAGKGSKTTAAPEATQHASLLPPQATCVGKHILPLPSSTPPGRGTITVLHTYNQIKDAAQKLCGLMAEKRGISFKEMAAELGLPTDE